MLLAYSDNGPGPVVVLLHGFPLDRTMWAGQTAGIGTTYRLIAPDLRGLGQTAAPDGTYPIDAMADDVIELLDALQIGEPVVLGGLSMGGYVALSAVVRYTERFRALILMDTRASADAPEVADGRRKTARGVLQSGDVTEAVETMLPKLFSPLTQTRRPDRIEQTLAVMLKTQPRALAGALLGMADRPDRTDDLARIDLPTLVIVGEDDVITPVDVSQAMAAALPRARLTVIPDAGHMAPLENPEAVNDAILDFLAGLA